MARLISELAVPWQFLDSAENLKLIWLKDPRRIQTATSIPTKKCRNDGFEILFEKKSVYFTGRFTT